MENIILILFFTLVVLCIFVLLVFIYLIKYILKKNIQIELIKKSENIKDIIAIENEFENNKTKEIKKEEEKKINPEEVWTDGVVDNYFSNK